jgi:hypothetical protein
MFSSLPQNLLYMPSLAFWAKHCPARYQSHDLPRVEQLCNSLYKTNGRLVARCPPRVEQCHSLYKPNGRAVQSISTQSRFCNNGGDQLFDQTFTKRLDPGDKREERCYRCQLTLSYPTEIMPMKFNPFSYFIIKFYLTCHTLPDLKTVGSWRQT